MKRKNTDIKEKIRILRSKFREKFRKDKKTRLLTKGVLLIVFLFGLYLILYPFLPSLIYKLTKEGKEFYPYKTKLLEDSSEENVVLEEKEIPSENRLVIPAIDVDMPIVEGSNDSALDLGVWHRPGTGYPGVGNMVLTGHRVGYAFLPEDVKNSTSFYNLDKLANGDVVIIYWNMVEYDYTIYDYEIVDKMDMRIEGQEGDERLTLYTCHPLGQNDQRLVYYAKPVINE